MQMLRSIIVLALAAASLLTGCGRGAAPGPQGEVKVGVLLVAHGSRSSTWVSAVEGLAQQVREAAGKMSGVSAVRLAYITETKPDIASEMRTFDAEGIGEVIVVPLLIANDSVRTNNYLAYLAGVRSEAKAIKQLQNEGYDIYYPRARISVAAALSGSDVLKKNALRRVQALLGEDSGEDVGVLLVGYGDRVFGQQMEEMMEGIGRYLKIKTKVDTVAFAFCGKLVDYSGEPVVEAINEVLELEKEVIVIPVLLAVDEMMQVNTIQAAINAIPTSSKVRYKTDAVLPDPEISEWILTKIQEAVIRAKAAGGETVPAPNRQ